MTQQKKGEAVLSQYLFCLHKCIFLKNWLSIVLICNRHLSTAVMHIIIVIIVISRTVTNDRMQ